MSAYPLHRLLCIVDYAKTNASQGMSTVKNQMRLYFALNTLELVLFYKQNRPVLNFMHNNIRMHGKCAQSALPSSYL